MPLGTEDIERLYELCAGELLGFLVARTLDPDSAVELLGETFAEAFLSRERFRGRGAATERAWLYGIARNVMRDYLRRGRVERRALTRLGIEPQSLGSEENDRIERALVASSLRKPLEAELD